MPHLDADSVAALLGGDLPPQLRAEIDEHVDSCDTCRRWVAAAARDHAAHDSAPAPSPTATETRSAGPPRPVVLAPGDKVGRYVVVDFLGAGGMGTVYAAHDPQLDRTIALKVVKIEAAQRRAERLVREAQAMARLSHANVVPIYDAGQDGSLVFIAMKRIDGAPLHQHLAKARPKQRDVLRLLCGAGRGLAAAHAAGIVHRDFKPDNVLVDSDGAAKVADFGLAALSDDAGEPAIADGSPAEFRTADGTIVGTPAYMAPEVQAGQRGDALSDQYSFALTVAEAVGERPPRRIRRALERARAADPKARFPTMEPLLRKLERRSLAIPIPIAVAVGVVAAVSLAWPRGADAGAACGDDARGELARVLGPIQRASLGAHFASLTPIHARGATLALEHLDRYAAEWVAMRESTCRATRVTGEQPIAVHDLRVGCLDERLDELAVVRDSLATLDDAHADSAARLAQLTSDLEQCANPKSLAATETGAAQARALRWRLVQAHAQLQEGHFDKAEPMLDAVLADARAAHLPAVEGAVLLSRSTLLAMSRRPGATEGFHEALSIAERIGDAELRVDALIALLADASIDRARASEVELLAKLIEAGLDDLPGPQRLRRARAQANLANYYEDKPDFAAAERASKLAADAFRDELGPAHPFTLMAQESQARIQGSENHPDQALAITAAVIDQVERTYGSEHPLMAESLLSQGVYLAFAHRNGEAMTAFRRALALAEKVYGPNHPRVAAALRKVGFLALDRDPAAARDAFARAIAIETAPPRHETPDIAPLLEGLGEAQLMAGDPTAAVATLEHCFAVWGDSQVAKHLRPQAKFALARALWESHGDRARARRLATDARDEFIANGGPWVPRSGEIDKWLAKHR